MSCIVALVDNGKIWMGGDSASTVDDNLALSAEPKVFRRVSQGIEWLFGCAGATRFRQIIKYEMELPAKQLPENGDPRAFAIQELIPLARKAVSQGGFLRKKDNVEGIEDGNIILGLRGRIFMVDSFFCILENSSDFAAIGSGKDAACGALYATPHMRPHERILTALKAAESACTSVHGPFHIIHSKK